MCFVLHFHIKNKGIWDDPIKMTEPKIKNIYIHVLTPSYLFP